MKLTIKSMYIWAAATLMGLAACTEDVSVDAVFITAAEKSPVTNFSVKQEGDALGITVSSALIAKSDVQTELAIDNSLVESYNSAHGEGYQTLPEGTFSLSDKTVVIKNGQYRSSNVKFHQGVSATAWQRCALCRCKPHAVDERSEAQWWELFQSDVQG